MFNTEVVPTYQLQIVLKSIQLVTGKYLVFDCIDCCLLGIEISGKSRFTRETLSSFACKIKNVPRCELISLLF